MKIRIKRSVFFFLGMSAIMLTSFGCTTAPVNCSTANGTSAAACGALGCAWSGAKDKLCFAPRCDSLLTSASCTKFAGNLWDPSQNCICSAYSSCGDITDDSICNALGCVWDNVQCLTTGTNAPLCSVATTQAGCEGIGCVWDPANINNNNKAQCLSKARWPFGDNCTKPTTQTSCIALGCPWSGTVCGNPNCSTLNQGQCAGLDKCVWDTTTCIVESSSCGTAKTKAGCGAPGGLLGCVWSGTDNLNGSCISEQASCAKGTTLDKCGAITPTGECVWDPRNGCLSTSTLGDSCSKGTVQSSCVGLGCVWDGNDATTGTCVSTALFTSCGKFKTQGGCSSQKVASCNWNGTTCVNQ